MHSGFHAQLFLLNNPLLTSCNLLINQFYLCLWCLCSFASSALQENLESYLNRCPLQKQTQSLSRRWRVIDTMPSWSPDGKTIALSSNRHWPDDPSVFGIYIIRADGSEDRRVVVAGFEEERERLNYVCFSADMEWLLFTANLGGVTAEPVALPNQFQPYGDLYVVRLDGSGLQRLPWNAYEDGVPAWHPRVLYNELDLSI